MNYNGVTYSDMDERKKHIIEVYNKHRNANMHKMVDIPIYYKGNE